MIAAARLPRRKDPCEEPALAAKSPWPDLVFGPIVVYGHGPSSQVLLFLAVLGAVNP